MLRNIVVKSKRYNSYYNRSLARVRDMIIIIISKRYEHMLSIYLEYLFRIY